MEYLKKKEKLDRSQGQLVETSKRKINSEENILTIDDVSLAENNLPLQQYDAFILFADNDIDFATEMIEKVENYGFKVNYIDDVIITILYFTKNVIAVR